MNYLLTLTHQERLAFDFLGSSYNSEDVAKILIQCIDWDYELWTCQDDLIFIVPKHLALQIEDLAAQEGYLWPCFSPALRRKLNLFLDSIYNATPYQGRTHGS